MLPYKHFAFPNLYLVNGYQETKVGNDTFHQYEDLDGLEHCVRRLVLRKPQRLRGWDLRFLRRGLGLTQNEFGRLVDRTEQTVARWEKSPKTIPIYVDHTMRSRFAQRFEPTMTTEELLTYVDGRARPLPEKICLRHVDGRWTFELEPRITTYVVAITKANTEVKLPAALGPMIAVDACIKKETRDAPSSSELTSAILKRFSSGDRHRFALAEQKAASEGRLIYSNGNRTRQ